MAKQNKITCELFVTDLSTGKTKAVADMGIEEWEECQRRFSYQIAECVAQREGFIIEQYSTWAARVLENK